MSLRGSLKDLNLTDTVQILEMAGNEGCLEINNNNQVGRIYFKSGKVVHATLDNLVGQDVIFKLLSWDDGEFEFRKNEQAEQETIKGSIQKIFLEGIKKIDEGRIKNPEKTVSTETKVQDILKKLMETDNQILGAMVVNTEGKVVVYFLSKDLEKENIKFVPGVMVDFYNKYKKTGRPAINQIFVNDAKGFVSLVKINNKLFLVSLSAANARLGSILFALNKTVEDISKVIG